MSKTIREDLEGVVYVRRGDFGTPVALRAGDKVPSGVTVGDHLLARKGRGDSDAGAPHGSTADELAKAKADTEAAAKAAAEAEEKAKAEAVGGQQGQGDENPLPEPPRNGAGSGVAAWQAYADAIGVEIPEGASRDEIIAAVDEARD